MAPAPRSGTLAHPSVLGGLSLQKFLRDYWHKEPLLIRQAIPGFKPILERDALFALAANPEVESRLVALEDGQWKLAHGPFKRLPSLRKKNWTTLIQGVNLHDDRAAALIEQFRFIPDARLDDLMISFATDGGGVGPHFDSYDVFLLQAHGKRRWRISAQQDLSLIDGLPLKILRNFEAEREFVLEPGDMLYLPPRYAHDGIAEGECMTYSIGFRAPSWQELGVSFLEFMLDTLDLPGRYADPDLKPSSHPAKIPQGMLERVGEHIRRIRFDDEDIAIFLGEYLSEPKPSVVFVPPARKLGPAAFLRTAQKRGLRLDRRTRMLYRGQHLFINGESFVARGADRKLLTALADARRLDGSAIHAASHDMQQALHDWHQAGWLHFA